ncbi:hypothetical protein KIH74_07005 [Kineosporia sp. J2-2]|uniref:Coenzyme Q-binding protein COQ10 START domain-containing protein n=1 Tax=Kineosporia corallincola TaxID=2835133 RepID=A0ABS5TGE0_9ACTN|nr:hypothetical protein [Kineosporia corallincola]
MDLTATTTIRKLRSEIYSFWRNFENLPTFMAHLDEVRTTAEGRGHWTATAPSAGASKGMPAPTTRFPNRKLAGTAWETPTSQPGKGSSYRLLTVRAPRCTQGPVKVVLSGSELGVCGVPRHVRMVTDAA